MEAQMDVQTCTNTNKANASQKLQLFHYVLID